MDNSLAQLQRARDITTHAEFVDKEITLNGEKFTFTFRRLPYIEVDRLRLRATNEKGQFDADRYAGNNGRWVAACLVDSQTHLQLVTEEEVKLFDTQLVDALAEAATQANAVNLDAAKAIEGNSGARQHAEPSAN